jgi:hypothetical protein
MTCEENLLKQAQLIKANNPLGDGQKVWVAVGVNVVSNCHRQCH